MGRHAENPLWQCRTTLTGGDPFTGPAAAHYSNSAACTRLDALVYSRAHNPTLSKAQIHQVLSVRQHINTALHG